MDRLVVSVSRGSPGTGDARRGSSTFPIAVVWQEGVAGADRRSSSTASAPETRRVRYAVLPEPGPPTRENGPDHPRDHDRDLGPRGLRLDGQQDQRARCPAAATYYADKVTVADESGRWAASRSAPMSLSTADKIRAVDGVDVVDPAVMMLMDDQASACRWASRR